MVFAFVLLLTASASVAQAPYLVKDINTSTDVGSSNPSQFVAVGTKTFFTTYAPDEGYQLWKTDGSGGGTSLVIDQYFSGISSMTASGGRLFFVVGPATVDGLLIASGPALGRINQVGELWTSDGTTTGTKKIRSVTLGGPALIADVNGTLFFGSDDGDLGHALWKTDGTTAGTVMVKALPPMCPVNVPNCLVTPSASPVPTSLTAVNGTLFFTTATASWFVFTGGSGSPTTSIGGSGVLWKSDGTEAGTVVVKSGEFSPANLMDVGGTLFFTSDHDLWKSDGTEAGTVPFANLGSLTAQQVTNVNGTLFFATVESAEGGPVVQLWKSDGTGTGTIAIKNICATSCISGASSWTSSTGTVTTYTLGPMYFTNVNGTLFYADSGALWKSDGTPEGTVQVAADVRPSSLAALNGTVYFRGYDSNNGFELWKSNGTANGTALVKDVCPGICSGLEIVPRAMPVVAPAPTSVLSDRIPAVVLAGGQIGTVGSSATSAAPIYVSNGKLYLMGCDEALSCEPWTSDGTNGGTALLKNVVINTASRISTGADLNGTFLFSAYDGTSPKLWRTDGTDAGTTAVSDAIASIVPGAVTSNAAFFIKIRLAGGFELWKTDGTETGTVLVKDVPTPEGSQGPVIFRASPLAVNGMLFFSANDGVHGNDLWKSDGTADGTVMVKDIAPGAGDSAPFYLTNLNGTLFFVAYNEDGGAALWKSDGSEAGTTALLSKGPNCSNDTCRNVSMESLTAVGNALFFVLDGSLYKTDGTVDGTKQVLLSDITLGTPTSLTDVNGVLFFWRDERLFKSNGTAEGTVVVKDFTPQPSGTSGGSSISLYVNSLMPMVNVNGTLFFIQQNALWKSDGTEAGTVKVKNISPSALTAAKGLLYFAGKDANGTELWKSDGTEAGTIMVADINPGPNGSFPVILGTSRGKLYFTANDGTHGTELWALVVAPTSVTLASSKDVVVANSSVTLTATVQSAVAGTIGGSVKFMEGTNVLGTVTVDAGGIATFSTTSLATGTHAITAVYSGDANFANSTSAAAEVVVLAAAPDYSLSANPTTATIRAGQSAQFVITATAGEYFNGTVTFSCGTLPRGVTCSFTPATLTPTSGHPAQTTLVVSTTSQTLAKDMSSHGDQGIVLALLGGSGVFGCLIFGRRKRTLWLALVVAGLLAVSSTACGGGGSSVRTNPEGTPSGTSTVTVTATATAGSNGANTAAHPLTLTVNVQ